MPAYNFFRMDVSAISVPISKMNFKQSHTKTILLLHKVLWYLYKRETEHLKEMNFFYIRLNYGIKMFRPDSLTDAIPHIQKTTCFSKLSGSRCSVAVFQKQAAAS